MARFHSIARRIWLAVVLAALVAASLMSRASAQDGAAAWNAGKLFVPASLSTTGADCESAPGGKCAGGIKPGKHPVVVFLHGCAGPRAPGAFLGLAAIVVAPNSFATGTKCLADGKHMAGVNKVRQADIAYAVSQIKAAAWADPGRLVLAGFSNGAQNTAMYAGGEFKARVIVAWTCNNPRAVEQNGVRGTGPVLALISADDEFYKQVAIPGNCNEAVKGRGEGSQSIIIPGTSHEILEHATTKGAVAKFLPAVIR